MFFLLSLPFIVPLSLAMGLKCDDSNYRHHLIISNGDDAKTEIDAFGLMPRSPTQALSPPSPSRSDGQNPAQYFIATVLPLNY